MVMDASAKLLKVVPEIYTIWNFRREALAPVFEAGGEPAQKASDTELSLTQACLVENPKSYSTWHHRKWVVLKGMCNLDAELRLVSNALDADERNFHAWNYRQFVVRLMKRPLQEELLYSEDKVAQNFSNYSAWHYRSILLHRLHCAADTTGAEHAGISAQLQGLHVGTGAYASSIPSAAPSDNSTSTNVPSASPAPPPREADASTIHGANASSTHEADASSSTERSQGGALSGGGGPESSGLPSTTGEFLGSATQQVPVPVEVLDEEYDMVHQAFATDSRDQSPWMYYRWLVGNSLAHLEQAKGTEAEVQARTILEAVLARETQRMRVDHLAADPNAKWPLLTLARLREAQGRLGLCAGEGNDTSAAAAAEANSIYERLICLDPLRAGFYKDALEGKAFVVVSALGSGTV
ncbi:hypothetical protein DUNSADRAFT_14773 [Dunaliella salina]|uniref:Geranylgeranyl transferase type-2 subunit alpha n=1 Tax=Dunaliella salina TaxID=3046 RepID=A0ABQ7G6Q9_DUNSA|nr:hypothetical protein DUNSADRAFT_14773 [Dunaliella salina]|eukprot:KAF5830299.1 hypothetical protein DUNSADRAFT_14773 [Dunaliella salina]